MRLALLETKASVSHFVAMADPNDRPATKRATKRPEGFKKPAHWTNDPPPEPAPMEGLEDDPQGLSPTRYGDWVKDGIAIDFS